MSDAVSYSAGPKLQNWGARLVYAFGKCRYDGSSGELHKESGESIRLTAQLSQLLNLLLARFPEAVTREEIGQNLWPKNPPSDLAHSVRIAVRRLREELDDSTDNPRYLETIPQRGYRWMMEYRQLSGFSFAWLKWLIPALLLIGVGIFYFRRPSATELYNAGEQYQKGVYTSRTRRADDLRKSIAFFDEAIRRTSSSTYAGKAYAGKSNSYALLSLYGGAKPHQAMANAREAYKKAQALAPDLGETHAAHAEILGTYDWDWPQAENEYAKAIELAPTYGPAYMWYARCLVIQGKFQPGMEISLKGEEVDGELLIAKAVTAWFRIFMGQYERAATDLDLLLKQNPTFASARWRLGLAYQLSGKPEEALKVLQEEKDPDVPELGTLGYVLALNKKAGAKDVLEKLLQLEKQAESDDSKFVSPYWIAAVYVGMGNHDEAFKYLSASYQQKDGWIEYLKVDPIWTPLRSDPRFAELLNKLRL
jgi:DNA-binding winged helix-turn-helix (wHTH) protein/Flp pilus assembly protein TadD